MASYDESQRSLRGAAITLNTMLEEKDSAPLYVVNTTDLEKTQPRGELYLTIRSGERDQVVKIPNTWIPIDLTAYAPRSMILNSADFRQALQRRRLTAVSSKVAEEVLLTEEAEREFSLLRIKENYVDPDAQAAAIDRAGLDNPIARANANRRLAQGTGTLEGVQPQVVGLVEREDISDRDLLTGLRNIASLTEKDHHYIMSRINASEKPRTAEFCRAALSATSQA